jgi:transposase
MTNKAFAPGDRVRFTMKFLKATGIFAGPRDRQRWTVVSCQCDLCTTGNSKNMVAVDEPLDTSFGYEDQTQEWRDNAKRHIAACNLEKVIKKG